MTTEKHTNAILDFDRNVDDIGVELDLQSVSLNRGEYIENSITTGSLSIDLITGGGWAPGRWNTIYGPEASGKSTEVYAAIGSAINSNIPVFLFDHEASTDPTYMARILGRPLEDVMGIRNEKGVYEKPPLLRYYQPDTGEQTFRFMHRILKKMPDKTRIKEQWYIVYRMPATGKTAFKKNIDAKVSKGLLAPYDDQKFKDTGRFYIPVDNGLPQAIFFIDSFISMLPEAREDDDEKSAMAKVARMFSDNANLIKTGMGRKSVILVGTNQIRLRPMAMGNPEYEPGGETIKFYSDMRLRLGSVAPSTAGGQKEEPCWDGRGKDCYRYIKAMTNKNKMFSPFREAVLRICYETKGEPGYGLDPMWDAWQYLRLTGQVTGAGRYKIKVPGPWTERRWTWLELKELTFNKDRKEMALKWDFGGKDFAEADKLCNSEMPAAPKPKVKDKPTKDELEKLQKHAVYLDRRKKADVLVKRILKSIDLRAACRKQFTDGSAFRLYFDSRSGVDDVPDSSEAPDGGSMDTDE